MFHSEKRRRPGLRLESGRNGKSAVERSSQTEPKAVPWLALAFAVISALVVTLIVDGGDRPFPYQLGQRVDRDVRLRETLTLYNETKTRQKREENAGQALKAFRGNNERLTDLRSRVADLLQSVGNKTEFSQLDARVRSEWLLSPEKYQSLRQIVPHPTAVRPAIEKLNEVFATTLESGVLEPSTLPNDSQADTQTIEIWSPMEKESRFARLEDVLLPEFVNPKGILARRLEAAFAKGGQTLFGLMVPRLKPTLEYDAERTRDNRDLRWSQVELVYDTVPKGTLVVEQGHVLHDEGLRLLREEHHLLRQKSTWKEHPERLLGTAIIVFALYGVAWYYLHIHRPKIAADGRQMIGWAAATMTAVVLARLLRTPPYYADVLPVAVVSLLWAVAYDRMFATLTAFTLSLLVALMHPEPMYLFVLLVGGTSAGVLGLQGVKSRTKLMRIGCIAGLGYGLLSMAWGCLTDQPWNLVLKDAVWRAGSGVVAGFLINGFLPFVEQLFGVVTAISLKELADNSHPLLRELVRKAPGTFNHSWTVSIMGEAAAKAIGADAELVRVGALFHDIGKMNKAQYFIENKSPDERNRHDLLAPAMSTLIIIGHVKDGVDLGRQHHLPQRIMDMIEQHHGTTRVDYFYREATRAMKENPLCDEEVEEAAFRYPGPRPQHKEAAVLMLTDCVESASRTLSEPTPARIEKLVNGLAMNRLLDGQFDESGLTLQELKIIEDSLTKSLTSVYHSRVKYPAAS